MCQYTYLYFDNCQHAQFTRVNYCDKAKAIGLPHIDGHSQGNHGAHDSPSGSSSSSSSPTSSAEDSSTSHSHNHQQHHNTMSTFYAPDIGTPSKHGPLDAVHTGQAADADVLVPSSVLEDSLHQDECDSADTCLPLDMSSYSSLNIDIPFNTQSSMSMELTHDGKVTELVARFESYAGFSDAFEVPRDARMEISATPTHRLSKSTSMLVLQSSNPNTRDRSDHPMAEHTAQEQDSPRKPIPSQWRSTGPNLATAKRASERSIKKGSPAGSSTGGQTLRGARSSIDLSRAHSLEGTTFLTKDALAAVESNIASTPSPQSAGRPKHVTPKSARPAWQSPTLSSTHSSPRQRSTLAIKFSPTRPTSHIPEPARHRSSRAPSSVTTSIGDSSYHTAQALLVRSRSSSELSFYSAENDIDIPDLDLNLDSMADSDDEQVTRDSSTSNPTIRAKTAGRSRLARPTAPQASAPGSASTIDQKSMSTMAYPATSIGIVSGESSVHASRIPRAATIGKSAMARASAQESTMKKEQPAKAATIDDMKEKEDGSTALALSISNLAALSHSHVVDSRITLEDAYTALHAEDTAPATEDVKSHNPELQQAHNRPPNTKELMHSLGQVTLASTQEISQRRRVSVSSEASDTPSCATVKANQALEDPASLDSAVLYSRKKSNAAGNTQSNRPINVRGRSASASAASSSAWAALPAIDERSEHVSFEYTRDASGEDSLHGSVRSDLRATAAEFVPQHSDASNAATGSTSADLQDEEDVLANFDPYGLDMYGIPWHYHMYPVQFAFEQGFRTGQSKSPKKNKKGKQRRQDVFPPTSGSNAPRQAPVLEKWNKTSNRGSPFDREASAGQSAAHAGPSTPRAGPSTLRTELVQEENVCPQEAQQNINPAPIQASPFAQQLDLIAHQAALLPEPTPSVPRSANIDLTTIRNVGMPTGPRQPTTSTTQSLPPWMEARPTGRRNGLYTGRGTAGVPMEATAPFPDPVPPPGRFEYAGGPLHGMRGGLPAGNGKVEMDRWKKVAKGKGKVGAGGVFRGMTDLPQEYTLGTESCGLVDIVMAAERGGGEQVCNACEPDWRP